ncbi:MAG: alpha/beta hydrolase [Firmicutes bacterium]|nr:alpha/beta hydrolase [Bacillota bacterium]
MKIKYFDINGIPANIIGDASDSVYLFVHGQYGSKDEAGEFANTACKKGWQVVGIDLPAHGERSESEPGLFPWNVVTELRAVMDYLRRNWSRVSLRANSIGAWFCMLEFEEKSDNIDHCLFVSPVIDMECVIKNMMRQANVSDTELENRKEIDTGFGQKLSWKYYTYAKQNKIKRWRTPTDILYGSADDMTDIRTVKDFCSRFSCGLTVIEDGEHWFHTPEQLGFLQSWEKRCVR